MSSKKCSSDKCKNSPKETFEGKEYCGVHLRSAKTQKKKQLEKLEKEQKIEKDNNDSRVNSEVIHQMYKTTIIDYCEDFEKLGDVKTIDINQLNKFIQDHSFEILDVTGISMSTIKENPDNAFESKYTGYAIAQTTYLKKKQFSKRFF